jgi:hypothetical protein
MQGKYEKWINGEGEKGQRGTSVVVNGWTDAKVDEEI